MQTYPLQLLIRQADTVLHSDLITNTTILAQDGDALDLDTILNGARHVAVSRGGCTLDASPGTDAATPTNN